MSSQPLPYEWVPAEPVERDDGGLRVLARLPVWLHKYVVAQRHADYTAEEHQVWGTLVDLCAQSTRNFASRIYQPHLDGLELLRLDRSQIPAVAWINTKLAEIGWMTACVDGYLPTRIYAALLSHRVFPISRDIRHPKHIAFSPTPDLVHDIFGHLPLLFSERHREYLCELGQVMCGARENTLDGSLHVAYRRMGALKSNPDSPADLVLAAEAEAARVQHQLNDTPSAMTELSRIFLWSVEFGLIGTPDDYRVQGAGLLSSLGETAALFVPGVNVQPYSLAVARRNIHFSDFQSEYYVFRDYDELTRVLDEYRASTR